MNNEPTKHERAQRVADFIAKADSRTRDMMSELVHLPESPLPLLAQRSSRISPLKGLGCGVEVVDEVQNAFT